MKRHLVGPLILLLGVVLLLGGSGGEFYGVMINSASLRVSLAVAGVLVAVAGAALTIESDRKM